MRLNGFWIGVIPLVLAACGGGGSTGGGGGGTSVTAPASVSGDMIAYQTSKGWNYHGSAFGSPAVTVSVYADPPSSGVLTLVMFEENGTASDAFSGIKAAGLGLSSTSGYNATAYVLLNNNGSIYAEGAITGQPLLVPQTLVQGQTFATYPGVTATVVSVGQVPGESACPNPVNGATVQYTFTGQTYFVSYVPGCGITNYVGNHGENLTLASIGSYPQLGTQSVRRMSTLTTVDTLRSFARIIAAQQRWTPLTPP